MSPILNVYFTHKHTHTLAWSFKPYTDIRINRFVKLGLSSHIHRNHGIRCINALRSWICIRRWCATRTEDYSWQTLCLSHTPQCTQKGSQLISPTHWHTHVGLHTSCRIFSAHDPGNCRGYSAAQTATGCEAASTSVFFFSPLCLVFFSREC